MGLRFHRTVSDDLLQELAPGGSMAHLGVRAKQLPAADLQLRKARGSSHATLYIGLTSVLDVHEHKGRYHLTTHTTHAGRGGFDPAWRTPRTLAGLKAIWPAAEAYLASLIDTPGRIDARHFSQEGLVQSVMSGGQADVYGVIQREAVLWSDPDKHEADALRAGAEQRACGQIAAAPRTEPWWPGVRDHGQMPKIGDELDLLAVDADGRLLAIEVKPAGATKGIVFSPAQVFVYADLFARWLAEDPTVAAESLRAMAEQRIALGLLDKAWLTHTAPIRVAPIVAIGAGDRSPQALQRLAQVAAAVQKADRHDLVDPLEVWLIDDEGKRTLRWIPSAEALPADLAPPPPKPKPGRALAAAFEALAAEAPPGQQLFIGRQGGLTGAAFRSDATSGDWRTVAYRVEIASEAPNGNWFDLAAFRAATERI